MGMVAAALGLAGITRSGVAAGIARTTAPLLPRRLVGRARFGRIAIANSDAGAAAYTDSAIDQAHRAVQELLRMVEVFGVHLLTLDIRQHSGRHAQALEEVLAWAGVCPHYSSLSAGERFDCLARELQQTRPLIPSHLPFSPETREVIHTFRTIAAIRSPMRRRSMIFPRAS